MRIRARSRLLAGGGRSAAVAAALVPALALTAACGGGGNKQPGSVRASGAVGVADLTKALLTSSDVPHVQVLPAGSKTQLLGGGQKADRPACQPVADQWSSGPKHPRQVYAGAMITDTTDSDKNAKTISLTVVASYKAGEAKQVLDELSAAVKSCTSYKTTRSGVTAAFDVHAVARTAPGLGDQQVTYTIGDRAQGARGTVLVTVIRVGDTTAAYESVRVDHKVAALRESIPAKQAAKLREAAKSG